MRLRVLGSADAFASGGRGHAAYLLEGASGRVLLDCGPTTLPALRRLGVAPATIGAVLLSHFHGDHFGGVPFLVLDRRFGEAGAGPLLVAGPPGVQQRVAELARALYRGGAADARPEVATFLELEPEARIRVGPAIVMPFRVPHDPGEVCLGLRIEMEGKVVVYSGDTEWFEELPSRTHGADLLLLECTHAEGAGGHHVRLPELLEHRERLDCRRLLLTHLGPAARDAATAAGLPVADDGLQVDL
jgi:ribonuclease BN (tRNA processing enzyme)